MHLVRRDLSRYSAASNLSQNNAIRERRCRGEQLVNLGFGQSPFPVASGAVQRLRDEAADALYLPAAGTLQLRESVVKFHEHFDNFGHFSPDDVVCGPGSKELIFLIMTVFDGVVFVPSPSWTTYLPQTLLSGKDGRQISLRRSDNWKLTPQLLKEELDKVQGRNRLLILNNPDNPTGQAYTSSELRALAEVARSSDTTIVSDEIYARLHFADAHASIAAHCPERTIVTSGVSKWANAGGWRMGYALFPSELAPLRSAVCSAGTHTYSCVAAPVQHACCELLGNLSIAEGELPHSRRILAAVARHCERVLTSAGADVEPSAGGFYILPDFEVARPGLERLGLRTGAQMCERILADTGVALMSAGPAFLRPETELTVRLCFVDFDGAAALAASQEIGIDKALPEDFTSTHCEPTHSAVMRVADWLRSMSK